MALSIAGRINILIHRLRWNLETPPKGGIRLWHLPNATALPVACSKSIGQGGRAGHCAHVHVFLSCCARMRCAQRARRRRVAAAYGSACGRLLEARSSVRTLPEVLSRRFRRFETWGAAPLRLAQVSAGQYFRRRDPEKGSKASTFPYNATALRSPTRR